MNIPNKINKFLKKKYKMEYYLPLKRLTVLEKISVTDLIQIKRIIKEEKLDVEEFVVQS